MILIEENFKNKVLDNKNLRYNFAWKIKSYFLFGKHVSNSFVVINWIIKNIEYYNYQFFVIRMKYIVSEQ